MRGRPRIRSGDHGNIHAKKLKSGTWQALTWVRDRDGHRRQVQRRGRTKTIAEDNLKDALDERAGFGRDLNGHSTVEQVAERWFRMVGEMVDTGERAPNTLRVYRCLWETHVQPGVGALALRDADVTALDQFITSTRKHHGASVTKTARAVLNGVMGYAVRHGAIERNPMREVSRVAGSRAKPARSLTEAERNQWLQRVGQDEKARAQDIPDLSLFLLATGARIAEALAVSFQEISFADKTVEIDFQLIRIKGKGLRRMRTKTAAGERTLRLPDWAMEMLTRRYAELGEGPVFPGARSRSWRDPSNTSADFRDAKNRAEFDWKLTSHTFRKTVATILDEAGRPAREIADQMGHSRISMTQDSYLGRGMTAPAVVEAINTALRPPA